MSVFVKDDGTHHKRKARLIFAALVGLIVLALMMASFPVSAQDPEIFIYIDQDPQKADFTVSNDITILLTGFVTINTDSASVTVYFGIHAPEGWETYLSLEEETAYFGETTFDFEGEVRPSSNSPQKEYDVYIWASAESRDYGDIDWGSSPSSSEREKLPIEVIQNRVKMVPDFTEHRALPDSTITYTFEVKNVATVTDTFFITLVNDTRLIEEGWTITPSAESLALEPGESVEFCIVEHIPSDAAEGDYKIEVWVSSFGHGNSRDIKTMTTEVRLPKIAAPFDFTIFLIIGFVGTSIGLAALFGATEYGYLALLSLFLPLYVRLKKKDVLSHFLRGQIFGYIQANPGTHYNDIIQHLGLHNGVGAYHLRVLEREGFIKSMKDGIYKRFYPMGVKIPEKRLHLSRIQRDILGEIKKHPGVTQKHVAKLLDESKQVVNYHVKILENAGLIRLERSGRETACFAGKMRYVPREDLYEIVDEKESAPIVHI